MGKAPKLLMILVDPVVWTWLEIQKLAEQGHTVDTQPRPPYSWWDYDLILSEHSHRMNEDIRKWLKEAIGEARRIKYPSKGKGKDNDT